MPLFFAASITSVPGGASSSCPSIVNFTRSAIVPLLLLFQTPYTLVKLTMIVVHHCDQRIQLPADFTNRNRKLIQPVRQHDLSPEQKLVIINELFMLADDMLDRAFDAIQSREIILMTVRF